MMEDPVNFELVVTAAGKGAPVALIAQLMNVDRKTVYAWLDRPDVQQATQMARAKWAMGKLEEMEKIMADSIIAGKPIWQLDAWLLERAMPQAFANNTRRIELTGEGGGPVVFEGPKSVVYMLAPKTEPIQIGPPIIDGESREIGADEE